MQYILQLSQLRRIIVLRQSWDTSYRKLGNIYKQADLKGGDGGGGVKHLTGMTVARLS